MLFMDRIFQGSRRNGIPEWSGCLKPLCSYVFLSRWHRIFRQSVAGLEDVVCTCSHAHVQEENGEILGSEIQPKHYFFTSCTGQMWSFLSLFFFPVGKQTGGLTISALTPSSKTTSALPLRGVRSERLPLFTPAGWNQGKLVILLTFGERMAGQDWVFHTSPKRLRLSLGWLSNTCGWSAGAEYPDLCAHRGKEVVTWNPSGLRIFLMLCLVVRAHWKTTSEGTHFFLM